MTRDHGRSPRGPPQRYRTAPRSTRAPRRRGSRVLGIVLLVGIALFAVRGLVVIAGRRGPDASENAMGELVRIMYMHVPTVIGGYLAFFVTAVASAIYLWKRTECWDLLAASSAEIGVVFFALTLVTGSHVGQDHLGHLVGAGTPGSPPRLLLFLMYIGYLAVRAGRARPGRPGQAGRAVIGLVAVVNVPDRATTRSTGGGACTRDAPSAGSTPPSTGSQLFALLFGMVLVLAVFVWLMMHRFRVQYLAGPGRGQGLDVALAERRAEAAADGPGATGTPSVPSLDRTGGPADARCLASARPRRYDESATSGPPTGRDRHARRLRGSPCVVVAGWLASVPAEQRRWM